jgi:Ca2+/H+ antiporter
LLPVVVDVVSTIGASPETVTASFAARESCMLAVAVASSATLAVFCTLPKPERFAVTV